MKKKAKIIIVILASLILFVGCGGNDAKEPEFTMYSTDTVGATRHYLVGKDDYEPSGTYRIVCTKGHGCLSVNDTDLYVLSNDEYLGTEYSGLIYKSEISIELNGSDELMLRNYNSSDFEVEFYIVE